MKKILWSLVAALVLSALCSACDSGGDDEEDPGDFYVTFKLDGTSYTLYKGLLKSMDGTALSGEACGFVNDEEINVYGLASPFDPTSGAKYEEDYFTLDLEAITEEDSDEAVVATIDGVPYGFDEAGGVVGGVDYTFDDEYGTFTLTISKIGEVGETMEGTFSGTLIVDEDEDEDEDEGGAVTTVSVTDGAFKVIRN